MTTKTKKDVRTFLYNHARDLYREVADCSFKINFILIASNEFSDKLERRFEEAGFTIIHWGSKNHEHDIEIEVAK